MYKGEEIIAFTDKNKPIIWGLFLSTIGFKYAIGNIFFGILGSLFLVQIIQNKRITFNWRFLPVAIYFLWGVASLLWTTNISNTISGIGLTAPFLAIPLLISQYSDFGINDLRKTFKVFGVSLLIYFLLCCANACLLFFQDRQYSHFFYHALVSVFDNNAIYISLAVAICILINFNLPKKTTRDYFLIIFLVFFLLLLSSKNIIITTCLLVLSTLLVNRTKLKSILVVSSIASIIALLISISDNPIKARFLAELNLNTHYLWYGQDFFDYKFTGTEIRIFQWRLMGEMIQNGQVGILGLGLHNVDYLLEQYFSYYNLYKGYFYINFHNQYLQTLGELGFVGLTFLLTIFAVSIYNAFKFRNKFEILFVLLFMIAFFTESFLSRQKGVYLFAITYSLVSILSTKSKAVKELNSIKE